MSTEHYLTLLSIALVLVVLIVATTGIWLRQRTTARYRTEPRELRELRHVAYRDPLTGLGNRDAFHRLMAAPGSRRSTVILINLDGHRRHLQRIGARAFDEAFTLVADRVGYQAATAGGRVFRLRHDELAVVLPRRTAAQHRASPTHDDTAATLAGQLVAAVQQPTVIDALGAPCVLDLQATAVVTTAPGHTEPDGRLALAQADAALRAAKHRKAHRLPPPASPAHPGHRAT